MVERDPRDIGNGKNPLDNAVNAVRREFGGLTGVPLAEAMLREAETRYRTVASSSDPAVRREAAERVRVARGVVSATRALRRG